MAEAQGIQIAFGSQESRRYWHAQQAVFACRAARSNAWFPIFAAGLVLRLPSPVPGSS